MRNGLSCASLLADKQSRLEKRPLQNLTISILSRRGAFLQTNSPWMRGGREMQKRIGWPRDAGNRFHHPVVPDLECGMVFDFHASGVGETDRNRKQRNKKPLPKEGRGLYRNPAITYFRTGGHYHRPQQLNGRVRNGNACGLLGIVTGRNRGTNRESRPHSSV